MAEIFLIMLAAVLTENFIFVKFYGICPFVGVSDKSSTAFGMGMAVCFVMTVSNAVTNLIYKYVLVRFELDYLRTIAFILVIASLVQFIEMFLKRYIPQLYSALGIYLPLITTNCAVLGAALLAVEREYSFIESAIFGFSAALGFTLAIVIFAGVRDRMRYADPPKCFKGLGILLVAAGLLAMAFSGFSGISFS